MRDFEIFARSRQNSVFENVGTKLRKFSLQIAMAAARIIYANISQTFTCSNL